MSLSYYLLLFSLFLLAVGITRIVKMTQADDGMDLQVATSARFELMSGLMFLVSAAVLINI
jgi:hypothetical protein